MTRRLLDCNALLALGFAQHIHHARVVAFYAAHPTDKFLTTPVTELAFVRVGVQARYFADIPVAVAAFNALKKAAGPKIEMIPDTVGIDALPAYVKTAADTTDGHLLSLATRHGAKLATFDTGIPGAELIP
jgi:predicted nucleic acid-binding protein